MGATSYAAIHDQCEELIKVFAEERNHLLHSSDHLKHNTKNSPHQTTQEERDAYKRHSYSVPSQKMREDTFQDKIFHANELLTRIHEVHEYFLKSQRDYLDIQHHQNARAEHDRIALQQTFATIAKNDRRIIELNEEMQELMDKINERIEWLERMIKELKNAILADNARFMENFARNVNSHLRGMYDCDERGNFEIEFESRKVKLNINDVQVHFLSYMKSIIDNVGQHEEVNYDKNKDNLQLQLCGYIAKKYQEQNNGKELQPGVIEKEVSKVADHILGAEIVAIKAHVEVLIVRTDQVDNAEALLAEELNESAHVLDMQDSIVSNPTAEQVAKAKECVSECGRVVDASFSKQDMFTLGRMEHQLEAEENNVFKMQDRSVKANNAGVAPVVPMAQLGQARG